MAKKSWRERMKEMVFAEMEGRCAYCGKILVPDGDWHLEHMDPRAMGGSSGPDNLTISCPRCNAMKSCRSVSEFRAYIPKKVSRLLGQLTFPLRFIRYYPESTRIKAIRLWNEIGETLSDSAPRFFMDSIGDTEHG